jgi:hypothetical protein
MHVAAGVPISVFVMMIVIVVLLDHAASATT